MKFLNGFKTISGIVGLILTPLIAVGGNVGKIAADGYAAIGPLGTTLEGGFALLMALGVIHKVEKAKAAALYSGAPK